MDPPVFATTPASWGAAVASGDFDGDGVSDLVVGAPGYDENVIVPNRADTGVVQVFFGSSDGFGSPAESFYGSVANARKGAAVAAGDFDNDGVDELVFGEPGWSAVEDEGGAAEVRTWNGSAWPIATGLRQGHDSIDAVEPFDHFGSVLAVGDFDGDLYDDLAVGVPGENLEGTPSYLDAGAVAVFYGTSSGLNFAGSQFFHQGLSGLGGAQANARFGSSLAAGDFDGDGYDDLAIGVPYEDYSTVSNSGAVNVLYGSAGGLTASGDQLFDQYASGDTAVPEANDYFGFAIATYEGVSYDGLAIGAPGEDIESLGLSNVGIVHRFYGSVGGLVGSSIFHQETAGVLGTGENGEDFGRALAVGDFDDSGRRSDVAIGGPYDVSDEDDLDGAVNVLYRFGTADDDDLWQPDYLAGDGDYGFDGFGRALAAGNFDCDGYDDLATGSPYASIDGKTESGSVNVIYGGINGLQPINGDQQWDQGSSSINGALEAYDRFGSSLAVGNFDGACDDLAIGVPHEAVGKVAEAGAVNVLFGTSPTGLTSTFNEILHRGGGDLPGTPDAGGYLGEALAAGDFDDDGYDELVIGSPNAQVLGESSGYVHVVYGSVIGLALSGRQLGIRLGLYGTAGTPGGADDFGSALAVGDFNGDGHLDLAVGAPGRAVNGIPGAGAVSVYYGSLYSSSFEKPNPLDDWSSWVSP